MCKGVHVSLTQLVRCSGPLDPRVCVCVRVWVCVCVCVSDPYTVRDARLHLKHVRSLLRSLDVADAHNGANGSSLSYLSLYTRGPPGDPTPP